MLDKWPVKGYNVSKPSEAILKARDDKFFTPYIDKVRKEGIKMFSFAWGFKKGLIHRHQSNSFKV